MKKEYIVVASVNDNISVLNRITATYIKRHLNIDSLNVSNSSKKGVSNVLISCVTTKEAMEQIVKQIGNMIDVLSVRFYQSALQ
ncbi:MAG: hypothetical protein WC960_05730 [Bacteroidales bacterium]